jgi:deazaflavin-dependent oxidoreductase (nitroreductase family)
VDKRRVVAFLAKRLVNPVMKLLAAYIPGWSLLETTGRKTGRPHRNPVGNGLAGDTFWIVAEHGYRADYVRNIQVDPRVRIRVGGRWRRGVAHLMPEDDARARQRQLGSFNAGLVRLMATDLLTVRVDLEPP